MDGRSILASLVAHAVAFAAIAAIARYSLPSTREATPAAAPRVELVPIELPTPVPAHDAVDVVLLPERAGVVASTAAPAPRATPVPRGRAGTTASSAIATGTSEAAIESATPTPAPGALAMRGRRHDLSLDRDAAARIVGDRPAATEQLDDPKWAFDPKIQLRPSGGGKLEIRDRVAKVHVSPDGTVASMETAKDFTFKLQLPTPGNVKKQLEHARDELEAWRKDPYRATRVGTMQDLPRHLQAAPGACLTWNDPMCRTAEDWQDQFRAEDEAVAGGALMSGTADITGYLMRKLVGDPYQSRKLKLLDQTRAERVQIGTAYRGEQLDRSAELVQRNLVRLWRDVADPGERRAALFALWDECAEGDGAPGAAGDRARAMVIGWIRSHLPAGSPGAFSADDIARLDARRSSHQHFAPY